MPVLQQRVAQAERGEFAHGMRQQRDADAELLDLRRALVDAAGNPALLQIERERQPADAAADNCYLHSVVPISQAFVLQRFDFHFAELDRTGPVLQHDRALVEHAVAQLCRRLGR